jgi:hypothetical protein
MQKFTIQDIYDNLQFSTDSNGEKYVRFKDTAPTAMQQAFSDLMSEYTNNDINEMNEAYNVLLELTEHLISTDKSDARELGYYSIEWSDIDWSDIYYSDRLKWLQDNLHRETYYDDVKDNEFNSLFKIIGAMQQLARGNMAAYMFNNFIKQEQATYA